MMTDHSAVYRGLTAQQLELAYNPRLGRPDYATNVLGKWEAHSADARAELTCRLDQAYGPNSRHRFDVFYGAASDAPTLVYIHGGYWQRGEKSGYSYVAVPFVAKGINVVVLGYELCPTVSIVEITQQIRAALMCLWHQAAELGINRDRITVAGHSAGGHLTHMMMATAWPMIDPALPADLVKAGIAISPLVDLEPLVFTSINDAIGMEVEDARAISPVPTHPPVTNAPQLVVCGGIESDEFHRQADLYTATYGSDARMVKRFTAPGCDHFDVVNAFIDPENELFNAAIDVINQS